MISVQVTQIGGLWQPRGSLIISFAGLRELTCTFQTGTSGTSQLIGPTVKNTQKPTLAVILGNAISSDQLTLAGTGRQMFGVSGK